MYLKFLELMGFKSFAHKTVFEFQPGITAIIGPNGSGKSNICDAIRWVLGEQSAKALRGTKMSEVIFAGSADLRPAAFCQVKLLLDNEDRTLPLEYSEVSISRQLFRSGESNYIVNDTKTLLSNIKEMLMDTGIGKDGYSVIGQGNIDDIIFQRTQSRRTLIEEAAGITKFKHRKNSSLTKLDHTRTNITRLKDIIGEIENQLGPLGEQAEKTKKYQALAAEIRQLEIDLTLFDLNQLYSEQENIESMRRGLLSKIEELEKFLAEIDEKKAGAHERFSQFESALKDRQEEIKSVTQQIDECRKRMAVYREEIRSKQARSQAITEEIANIENILLNGEKEILEAENCLSEAESKEIELCSAISGVEKQIEVVRSELEEHLKEVAQDKDSAFKIAVKIADHKNRINTAIQQIQILEKQLEKGYSDIKLAQEQLEKLVNEKKRLEAEIEQMQTELTANKEGLSQESVRLNKIEREFQNTDEELTAVTDQIKILRARSNLLEEIRYSNDSGIYRGVQAALALKESGRIPGIQGMVGELITVPKGFEVAFETALGTSIQDVITDNVETAKATIAFLKENRAGKATFLPLDLIKAPPTLQKPDVKGCLGVALELVEYEARYYTVMSYLLGRILIFETIDEAVEFAKHDRNFSRIVTLDGDIMRSSGALTGGGDNKKSAGILTRKREQAELENKLNSLENREKKLRSLIGNLQKERQQLINSIRDRQENIRRYEQSLEFFQKSLAKTTTELNTRNENFILISRDREEIIQRLHKLQEELQLNQYELSELEKQEQDLSGRLNSMGDREEGIQSRLISLNSILGEQKLELAKVIERKKAIKKEIEAASRRRKDSQERQYRATAEVEKLNREVSEKETMVVSIQNQIDELEKRRELLESTMEEIQSDYCKISKELDQLDHAYQSRIRIEDSTRKKLSELDIKLAEINTHIKNKKAILNSEFNLDIGELTINLHKYESREELVNRIVQRKFEQEALEPVNPLAIEEYEKTRERYEFLNGQVVDMLEAASSLEQVIAEIEKISSERFLNTFQQISVAFNNIFNVLFPGGEGRLKLSDEKNPLESNVDIVCKLPGKKLSTLELFSGGEKALISLALLFAILQVKPPAFCLLDEVEAALDEVNVRRFTRMLRNFSDKTQFIVITHNKETMQAVDVIYGITMQKTGVSKPISIRLEDKDKIKEFTVNKSGQVREKKIEAAGNA